MASEKKSEWQVIVETQRKALAARTAQLRAARLAHNATLPPTAAPAESRRPKKKPA